jgi:hypothetical protein
VAKVDFESCSNFQLEIQDRVRDRDSAYHSLL